MMADLTAFQRDILYVIGGLDDDSPPYGLAIKEELDRHYASEINHGRLYPNLNDLVEMGLVEKGSVDDRTNSYDQGDGIAKIDRGYVVIVPGTRQDDEVTVEIENARENVAFARVRDDNHDSNESSEFDDSFANETLNDDE